MKLVDKDYKRAIKNMFKDLKEMVTILSDQMGNLSIEMGKKKGRKEREKEEFEMSFIILCCYLHNTILITQINVRGTIQRT